MPWVEYQVRYPTVTQLERARDSYLTLPVYDDGALAAPSSGTISIYNPSGTAVVDGAAVTITGSIATYTITAATVATESFGSSWRVEWALVMPDTETHLWRHDAALVRVRLDPVVTDADLLARHSDLNSYLPSSTSTGWEVWIQEAWREVLSRLEMTGRRPWLIMTPQALRPIHIYTTLGIICRDLSGGGDEDNKWTRLADRYSDDAERAWATVNFAEDADNDGSEGGSGRTGATSTVWLARSPRG